jgi:hypothetical protein
MMSEQNYLHPAALPVEQQMDLLVDDELPEGPRRTLLKHLDQQPARWRELAVLFLERQTERSVARGAIEGREATRSMYAERIAPFHSNWKITPLKAAGLLILGGLTLAMTVPWGGGSGKTSDAGLGLTPATSSRISVPIPAQQFTGGTGTVDAQVQLAPGIGRTISGVLDPSTAPHGTIRHIIFTRDSVGHLVMVVVTTENVQ